MRLFRKRYQPDPTFGAFTHEMAQDQLNARIIGFIVARTEEIDLASAHACRQVIDDCCDHIDVTGRDGVRRYVLGAPNDMNTLLKLAGNWSDHPDFLPEWGDIVSTREEQQRNALRDNPNVLGWSKREGEPMEIEYRQAVMPKGHMNPTIAEMKIGDTGWAVPWALVVDSEQRCWLRPGYTVSPSPGGTVDMKVSRASHGYVVNIAGCDYSWYPLGDADKLSYIRVDTLDTP